MSLRQGKRWTIILFQDEFKFSRTTCSELDTLRKKRQEAELKELDAKKAEARERVAIST